MYVSVFSSEDNVQGHALFGVVLRKVGNSEGVRM